MGKCRDTQGWRFRDCGLGCLGCVGEFKSKCEDLGLREKLI